MIKRALGTLMGSFLGVLVIGAFVALPIVVVLWIGSVLDVPWAIAAQVWIALALRDAASAASDFLPGWVWFFLFTLSWLAFLDGHVRALVRDELARARAARDERSLS